MTTTTPNLPADYAYLGKYLTPDTTVYVVVRSVARSGMSRVMSFYVPTPDGDMLFLDGLVGAVVGGRVKDGDGIRVFGYGMDMAAHVVGRLSEDLWGDFYAMRARVL